MKKPKMTLRQSGNLSESNIHNFQKKILGWFAENKRDLPWRRDRDPYHILLSEVMLQQTQVSRVMPKYEAWLMAFPTLKDLTKAPTAEVLRLWSGLGYNRRAINLHQLAQQVTQSPFSPQSALSPNPEALKKLPGIGDYTARAIACFAFDVQIAVVDTNVRKVIAVEFFHGKPPDAKITQAIADQLLPKGQAYEWNQALMDYAAALLKKEKIPITKQTPFIGSNRYYRGQILKLLLQEGPIDKVALKEKIGKDAKFCEKIIAGLVADHLVVVKNDTVALP